MPAAARFRSRLKGSIMMALSRTDSSPEFVMRGAHALNQMTVSSRMRQKRSSSSHNCGEKEKKKEFLQLMQISTGEWDIAPNYCLQKKIASSNRNWAKCNTRNGFQ